MKMQEGGKAYDEINVVPMLDLSYVLLVIFIIMTTASVQGVKVELPKSKTTASLAKPGTRAVTVSERGDLFLDAYPMTMESLEERLGQLKAGNPALPIVVKGDGRVQYGKVMEVLEMMKRLDIVDVGLVTVRAK
jgi:biopolymer transport protein ExbD